MLEPSKDAYATADMLLASVPDYLAHARLLAASTKESGAWPHALPITSLGLRMDDTTLRIAEIGHYHMCSPCLSSLWGASRPLGQAWLELHIQ